MNAPSGHWPKWLTGAINVVGDALQAVAGAALVAAAPVSGGLSAVVGGALLVNGAATIAAGAGQIINSGSEKGCRGLLCGDRRTDCGRPQRE